MLYPKDRYVLHHRPIEKKISGQKNRLVRRTVCCLLTSSDINNEDSNYFFFLKRITGGVSAPPE
jgi:hypothetical protein